MELTDRKKQILKVVVEDYVRTAEPVGSKAIAAEMGGVSSATIRNELSDLTELGYLEQPHTSAGRVPSAKGYRLYVNELMERRSLSREEEQLFFRKYYYCQSTAQIAAELGITERAAEGRLYRLRQRLRNLLGGDLL